MTIKIRKTRISDAKAIHKLINNKNVIKELSGYPFPCPLSKIKKDISKGLDDWKKKKAYTFTILADKKIVGQVFLENPSKDNGRYEVGYFIGKQFWNKGIATKSVKEVVKFGFKELGLYKIWGDNDSDNRASGKVMKNTGFKLEGRLKKHCKKEGKFIDVLIWGKLK
ncbi:MAG: GNAT family N-acetyltransferase [Nanoarchaeota archaeon]|nr:GNAT family N-acetyltransferase [Nanoarchaeota archaeon]MBU1052096.1 GNAT family N-acetyltransferase [Nanoarchaeota archaeon]MBU1988638.1 GNAT family N-acetyltransferase [Nanoarchaeota archaeon]